MINYTRLETTVMNDEGFRARPYLDTVGVATIGYGSTFVLGERVSMDWTAITADTARELLRGDLYQALIDAQAVFSRFNDMNDVRQEVIVNMAYNLGRRGLAGFKRMVKKSDYLDYAGMAFEMQNSKWFSQVGLRSIRLVLEMRSGQVAT